MHFIFGKQGEKCKTYALNTLDNIFYNLRPGSVNGVGYLTLRIYCFVNDIFAVHGSIFI